eukprot:COSAG04_NODE_10085_length_805_cov_1.145892_1_plen_197_part_10
MLSGRVACHTVPLPPAPAAPTPQDIELPPLPGVSMDKGDSIFMNPFTTFCHDKRWCGHALSSPQHCGGAIRPGSGVRVRRAGFSSTTWERCSGRICSRSCSASPCGRRPAMKMSEDPSPEASSWQIKWPAGELFSDNHFRFLHCHSRLEHPVLYPGALTFFFASSMSRRLRRRDLERFRRLGIDPQASAAHSWHFSG